uniref:Uncharacterized protein n=1 Tax=Anguilla anguilla TaxID=7936 RepID=A0A0E9XVS2_ANGAN
MLNIITIQIWIWLRPGQNQLFNTVQKEGYAKLLFYCYFH